MGWIDCSGDEWRYQHEGYVVGIKRIEGTSQFRELGSDDLDVIPLNWIQVGCECGWRSPRILAPSGTKWTPCCVTLPSERKDDEASLIWQRHVSSLADTEGMVLLR